MNSIKPEIFMKASKTVLFIYCICALQTLPVCAQSYYWPYGNNYYPYPYYAGTRYPIIHSYRGGSQGRVSTLSDSRSVYQTKKTTTWEAPTKEDNKIDEEIEATQVDYGVDSKEALELIFSRARRYYDSHQYEKALKLLNQLDPLLKKKNKTSLISSASINKLRGDINLKLGNQSSFKLGGSKYLPKGSPVSIDSFTFSDPRNPFFNSPYGSPYGSGNTSPSTIINRRNFYP